MENTDNKQTALPVSYDRNEVGKSLVTYSDYHGDFCIKLYSVLVKHQASETTL